MALTVVKTSALSGNINLTSQVTGALPVANGGTALTSGFVNGGAIKEIDQWRLTTSFSGDAEPITSNWERIDTTGQGYLGTGMSESSGVFTFPSTGIWLVTYTASYNYNGDARFQELYISIGGTKVAQQYAFVTNNGESGANYSNGTTSTTVDVTDTSAQTITLSITASQSGSNTNGESDKNRTFATFMRLGDTQNGS